MQVLLLRKEVLNFKKYLTVNCKEHGKDYCKAGKERY